MFCYTQNHIFGPPFEHSPKVQNIPTANKQINILINVYALKKVLKEILSPLHLVRIQQEGACYESRRGPSPEYGHSHALILDFPDSRTMQNKFLLLISYSVSNILLEQPEWTKTASILCLAFSTSIQPSKAGCDHSKMTPNELCARLVTQSYPACNPMDCVA